MSEKKKLLITTDNFLPRWDGIARFLSELIPKLTKDFEVTVIAPDFGKLRKIENVKVIRFPVMKMQFGDINFTWFRFKEVSRIVSENDIVFNQTIGPIGIAAIRAANKQRKSLVSYVHSIEWELASEAIKVFKSLTKLCVKLTARRFYNKCTLLLVPSKGVEDLLTLNRITRKKSVVKLGVDAGNFAPPLTKFAAKRKIGIQPSKKVIGFSGRIGREKDLNTLLNAFKRLREKYKDAVLLIVGKGVEEEEFKQKNVILAGSVMNLVPYLQAMDIFVLPSLTETSSLATMEAMAVGLPVIATPVGSVKEYVEDGKNGFIFPRKDYNYLADKIELLLKDEKLRAQIGREARKTIISKHRWDDTVKKIVGVLREL